MTGVWATSVSVVDMGRWTVTTGGSVAFTPALTFDGATSPLSYQVADINGTYAESTLVVTVAAPYGAVSDPDTARATAR